MAAARRPSPTPWPAAAVLYGRRTSCRHMQPSQSGEGCARRVARGAQPRSGGWRDVQGRRGGYVCAPCALICVCAATRRLLTHELVGCWSRAGASMLVCDGIQGPDARIRHMNSWHLGVPGTLRSAQRLDELDVAYGLRLSM